MAAMSDTASTDLDKLDGGDLFSECIRESDFEAISIVISQQGIGVDDLGRALKLQGDDIVQATQDESETRGQVLSLLRVWKLKEGNESTATIGYLGNALGIEELHQKVQDQLSVGRKFTQ